MDEKSEKIINQDTMPVDPRWPKKAFFWLFTWNIWTVFLSMIVLLSILFYYLLAGKMMPNAIWLLLIVVIANMLAVLYDYVVYRYLIKQYKKFYYEITSDNIKIIDYWDKEWLLDFKTVYKVYYNQDFLDKRFNFYTVIIETSVSGMHDPLDWMGKWGNLGERQHRKSIRLSYFDDFIIIPGLSKENAFYIKEFILRKIDQPQEKNVSKNIPYKI